MRAPSIATEMDPGQPECAPCPQALLERFSALRPKSLAVFELLYRHRGRVLSKGEIFDVVWAGRSVTDDSLVQCICEIRRALASEPALELKTFARRGYRLTSLADPTDVDAAARLPTIAVLPFTDTGRRHEAALAHALTEDITTELSRHKEFLVIANHSAMAYRRDASPLARIGSELRVRYLLQGSVQLRTDAVRVNVRLADTRTNTFVWTKSHVHPATQPFDAQDDIVAAVVNRLGSGAGIVVSAERSRLDARRSVDLQAYEHYLLGSDVERYFTAAESLEAIAHLEKALEMDPLLAKAWSRLAILQLVRLAFTYTDDPEETGRRFVTAALTAVEVDPHDPFAHAVAGGAHYLTGEGTRGDDAFERALSTGPNNADVLAAVAYIRPTKRPTAAEDLANVRRAMVLNPHHSDWYRLAFGYSAFYAGHYREAVAALQRVADSVHDKQLYLTLCHAQLGDETRARHHRRRLLAIQPRFSTRRVIAQDCICDAAAAARLADGAARAGLPP